jgi:hypothetical protein
MSRRSIATAIALVSALASFALWTLGAPVSAQEQKAQAVGVAPITDKDPAPRDSALRAAVRNAVAEAAAAMLPAGSAPPEPPRDARETEREPNAWLAEKLGGDPFAYVTRFRIVEDRGKRPAMFSADRSVEYEYVVLAEVNLDLDAIRAKMEKLGLAERGARGPAREVTLVVEGLTSYAPLAAVRKTLARERGVRSVQPVEFTAGRAVLAVDADTDAAGLVDGLTRRAPEGLRVNVVEQGPTRATVRVDWQPPAPVPAAPPTVAKPGPIDTP